MGRTETRRAAGGETALLERSEFLEALDESLARVAADAGRLVLVSGDAGIGKSALVRHFCDAHAARARVLWGACDALGTPRPLSPLIDIAADVQGDVMTSVREGAVPHAVFVALLEELRVAKPTIAVIEDVHWADEATLDIVRLLARRAEALGALVVVTYREDDLEALHPLRLMVGELGTAPGVVRLRLPPLSRAAVDELAASHGIDGEELYLKTAGNAFFVTEVLDGGGMEIPPTVRDAVLGRMTRLGAGAQGVLEAIAVVPPYVDLWLLDELVGDEAVHVDACLAAGMLQSEGRRISFRHELARLAVERSIGPYRRVLLHRSVLRALANAPEREPDPAQLAHHADAAGDWAAALEYATVAGERAAAHGAHREAAAQYARALRHAGSLDLPALAGLLERQAQECYLTDQIEDAVAAQERAVGCYRELGDRAGEAVALQRLSATLWCPGRIADSQQAGHDAVEALAGAEPGLELAAAYANLAGLAFWVDAEAAVGWARRASELAERLGDTGIMLEVATIVDSLSYASGADDGRCRLEHTIEEGTRAGLGDAVANTWHWVIWAALQARAYGDFDRLLESGLAYCVERDHEMRQRYLYAYEARAALDRARWAEAAAAATFVQHSAGPSIVPVISALVVLGLLRARQGQPGAPETLEQAAALAERQGQLHVLGPVASARAEMAWLQGKHEEIAEITEQAYALANSGSASREVGELARWRWRAGVREHSRGLQGPDAATVSGDWADAARLWTALGCPYEAALALADANDDDALRQALIELQRLGAGPAAAIVTQRLRQRGVRNIPRGPNAAARQNPASLTRRELEVLVLLADGLRNAEIAARLVVSERTVEHQVSAVLRKLGAHTRGEAAAIAVRDGLTAKVR